jgi:hypothetical protein
MGSPNAAGPDDDAPLPVWLKDRRFLNPLLTAYDERITELESAGADRHAAIAHLQEQVPNYAFNRAAR